MVETEILFKRTCNYWIDAGIVGLYDTLNKPVYNSEELGAWPETIKCHTSVDVSLTPDQLVIKGKEQQIDKALSHAFERMRLTFYDVSKDDQIANPEKSGWIRKMATIAGSSIVKSPKRPTTLIMGHSKKRGATYFGTTIHDSCISEKQIFFPLISRSRRKYVPCFFCGNENTERVFDKNLSKIIQGTLENVSPFVEGTQSNHCFDSYHSKPEKCWQCGYVSFFAPLLLFYRRIIIGRTNKETYYMLSHIPGNLQGTYKLYRSLSGKRGLARAIGSDHTEINYESNFKVMPRGIPTFTLIFYYDLFGKLLPKSTTNLLQASRNIGLIDTRGAIFQTAIFLKRDSGPKTFIMRETTVDRSAYYIKLYSYLKKHMDGERNGKLSHGLRSLIGRAMGKGNHLQRISVINASQAITEGRPIYRFLLPILSSDLKEETSNLYDGAFQTTSLFQEYDQWVFKKEDELMANIVKQANNTGWHLSLNLWKNSDLKKDEKKNLIKRYYYNIERAPSPVKFLEQVRHAWKKAYLDSKRPDSLPEEMTFHNEAGDEEINKFEVYRVYFLAGMLNGLLNKENPPKLL
jgi:hypothetical protein